MRCPNCTTQMGNKHGTYQYKESGLDNIWLKDWPMLYCPECKLCMPVLPGSDVTTKLIASELVREKGRLDGDSIVFLRKSMALKAAELAQMLGVDRVTVSRWENNKQEIDPYFDFKLRMSAIDQILPAAKRREAKEAVGGVLQHSYTPNIAMCDVTINVPAQEAAFA